MKNHNFKLDGFINLWHNGRRFHRIQNLFGEGYSNDLLFVSSFFKFLFVLK